VNTRHPALRLTAIAALTALAGFGAQAIEATQWEPQAQAGTTAAVNTDATREPGAWTVGRGEATEFHDRVAADTMRSRQAVRQELAEARDRGLLADAGEAGATEHVWQRRAEFAAAERAQAMAMTEPAGEDPIAELAAATRDLPVAEDGGSMYGLAPDGTMLRLPESPAAAETPPGRASLEATPATTPMWQPTRRNDEVVAEAPTVVDDGTGPLADSTTVEAR